MNDIISKSDTKLIVVYQLQEYNDDYDTLNIGHVYERKIRANRSKKNKKWKSVISINYSTTKGDYCSGFGKLDFDVDDIPNLLRLVKINELLN